jgi:hypothetical protein
MRFSGAATTDCPNWSKSIDACTFLQVVKSPREESLYGKTTACRITRNLFIPGHLYYRGIVVLARMYS